jgi:hypothetical protein
MVEGDRGMEQVKKLVSARLRSQATGPHPDADTLSAFAEQTLSDGERSQVFAHLANCRDCREVLYLGLLDSAAPQKVLSFEGRRASRFAVRWGAVAVAIAVAAVLFVGTRRNSNVALYKQQTPEKAPATTTAELKTPGELRDILASRDDRAKANSPRADGNKIIPTPKHMTAKPSAKFDFDQTDQVRMAPESHPLENDKFIAQDRNVNGLAKVQPGAVAAAGTGAAVGGSIRGQNAIQSNTTSGQSQAALAQMAQANLAGTIVDGSGAVIVNANITMDGPLGSRQTQSDVRGQFLFDRLIPGAYSLKAEAPGFKTTQTQQVAVAVGKPSALQMKLEPGSVSETVEVSSAAKPAEVSADERSTSTALLQSAAAPAPQSTTSAVSNTRANEKQADLARKKTTASYEVSAARMFSSPLQWTLSPSGAIQRSFDSGSTWQIVPVGKGAFRALSAAGADVWAGGNAGMLYHSSNSGQTWARVKPAAPGRKLEADITRIEFSDSLNGTVGTAGGEIWITSDGGHSWTVQ